MSEITRHKSNDPAFQRNNFDFLRLALAILVIFSHSFPLGTGSELREPLSLWTHGQMTFGAVAVDLFFVMSGFLIAASAERSRSILSFFQKRAQRIYPAFIVCALLTLLVLVPLANASLPGSIPARIGDVLLQTLRLREFHYLHAFAQNPYPDAINGSAWSIQYEFWCYVGVALLFLAGLLRKRNLVLALFLASVIISIAFRVQGWILGGKFLGVLFGSPQLWARLLPYYLAGVVFYLFRDRIRLNIAGALISLAALVAASFFSAGWTSIFPLAGTYLVFYIAFAPWLPLSRTGRFGDFSYGTYLYAFPIEQLLMQAFGHPVAPLLLFACAAPLTLLAAIASWYGVERRFLRRARRKETIVHAIEADHPAHSRAQMAVVSAARTDS
jgi:peptidoglycan/LPS O-acetylase OafA/YrhL